MKRTVSVNIKGMNFLIEEDAYELLQSYMERLNHGFRNEKGSKEIIEDIELRIAELCSAKLTDKKQVIEIEDIENILETLGDPSQYIDEENGDEYEPSFTNTKSNQKNSDKRLFRDIDNATIAGVCAGIANFFHIDVVIVRAIFVVMFFFGGFGLPLYIILWVIVPKANSTIDKLRMKGVAITVESVRNEVESAAERLKTNSKSFGNRIRKDEAYGNSVSSIGRLITVIFGAGFIAFGLFLLIMFLTFIVSGLQFFPIEGDTGFVSLFELSELVLSNESDLNWAWIGVILAGFSGILFILLLGVKIIFRIRNRWSKLSLGILFLAGFIGTAICIFIGAKTSREMVNEQGIERKVGEVYTEQLQIIPNTSTTKHPEGFTVKSNNDNGFISLQGKEIVQSGIRINYRLSKDSLFHVYQNLAANGYSQKTALEKSKNIKHETNLDSAKLYVNTFFTFPKTDKLRDQDVYLIIDVPLGKTVKTGNHVLHFDSEKNWKIDGENFYQTSSYLRKDGKYEEWD